MARRKHRDSHGGSRGSWLRRNSEEGESDREELARLLAPHELAALGSYYWEGWARDAQLPPREAWRTWLIGAGRGFGKTRAGSEWVRDVARHDGNARIALVGANLAEVRNVMVEGDAGVLAAAPGALPPIYEPSLRKLTWENGAVAFLYSAGEPESLRGPQHSHAWCDEIAKWDNSNERAMSAWNNLQLTMRLGEQPRVLATTTPRANPLMRRPMEGAKAGKVVVARGRTTDNRSVLPADYLAAMIEQFQASGFGRQELDGELLDTIDGALWTRALLERCRIAPPPTISGMGAIFETPPPASGRRLGGGPGVEPEPEPISQDNAHPLPPSRLREGEWYRRIVVAVDPPTSARGDACGIVVAGLLTDGTAHVLADASVEKASPERWARAVAGAAAAWEADRVVAEANQGGAMVESVLRAADIHLPLKLVHASRGKVARAEPIAALYEAGRVRHAGLFAALEDQLCGLMAGGGYEGPGRSPDRADALVWALTELMLKGRGEPRVRST
ncbi:DNA-packaging protein [Pseudoblastomonas halimionae]|uniref:ATP-binding protein n=1 Tax=Alteriqipengyuania halimionae TaxID=1926630 RepID=A0A6I4U4U6_9SPHN|nr:terminase family protein [Alteriqipengyuania halimionae]MXP11030.1 ATP-binding protein [Alteriqipengyuania halimionae]